jgi:3-oxoacyl-[acyl-carrier protein] reductase|tara:strand:- start:1017 stop:1772 length:756 start_codon:yes stop_codon:yes gene_type:complete
VDLNLKGLRVFVSGSSQGIGRGILEAFLNEGCLVVSNARNEEFLTESIHNLENCFSVIGDVSDPEQANEIVTKAVNLIGGIDILICNVGNGTSVEPGKESYKEWQRMFGVNFFSTTNLVEAATKELKKSKGVILCISSICGLEVIPGAPVTYSVAKAALNAYIRGISRPLAENGVRINGIAPGNILFPGSVWEKKMEDNSLLVKKMLKQNVPLNKMGTVDDVANLALWLSSPVSEFVTGAVFNSDGGQTRF